jgi:hypothetical protein
VDAGVRLEVDRSRRSERATNGQTPARAAASRRRAAAERSARRILLPIQVVILALMAALVLRAVAPGPGFARRLVGFAFVYWAAMGLRYGVRMARRPEQRWLGGTIPIVFQCVLAGCLFVLRMSHA